MGRIVLTVLLCAALGGPASAPAAHLCWPHDSTANLCVSAAGGDQLTPDAVSDGRGGVFLVWADGRAFPDTSIYAQHIGPDGQPRWAEGGVAVCAAPQGQYGPRAVADGLDGLLVIWQDTRSGTAVNVFAQRLDSLGTPLWAAGGVAAALSGISQQTPTVAPDGTGGAYVAWSENRNYVGQIFAQHLGPGGERLWAVAGLQVCPTSAPQGWPWVVSDGVGGALVVWQDQRTMLHAVIFAQRLSPSGARRWAASGVAACATPGSAWIPLAVSDGHAGAMVVWPDYRNSPGSDLYAQRFDSLGTLLWGAEAAVVCAAPESQFAPALAVDAGGNAIVAWEDYRTSGRLEIRAQRMGAAGARLWPAGGVLLCGLEGARHQALPVPDGAGGAVVAWYDARAGAQYDVYAQAVDSSGAVRWQPDGVAVCAAPRFQWNLCAAPDGTGGMLVAWEDQRNGSDTDLYAQRVEHFGYLGNPEPYLVAVRDVPGDQGGHARLSWEPSHLDTAPSTVVTSYEVWRQQAPAPTAVPEAARPARAAQGAAWEHVAGVAASAQAVYELAAPTARDSMWGASLRSVFRVEARTGGPAAWSSDPDSGHSVDNLPPVAPTGLKGCAAGGCVTLRWRPNPDPDVAVYWLHRGASPDFVPGRDNLVCVRSDTLFADRPTRLYCYKLSAMDIHGNRGPFTLLPDSAIVGAPWEAAGIRVSLGRPWPNPARGRARVRVELPTAATVDLALFDPAGRRVRTLLSGKAGPGTREVEFELRGPGGSALAGGLYWARLAALGRVETQALVVVR